MIFPATPDDRARLRHQLAADATQMPNKCRYGEPGRDHGCTADAESCLCFCHDDDSSVVEKFTGYHPDNWDVLVDGD